MYPSSKWELYPSSAVKQKNKYMGEKNTREGRWEKEWPTLMPYVPNKFLYILSSWIFVITNNSVLNIDVIWTSLLETYGTSSV